MVANVHQVNIGVKGLCAWGGIAPASYPRHIVPMSNILGPTKMREWREHRGLSLEVVAADLGITHGTLSKIERGLSPYNQRQLERLAELYDCDVIDLLARSPGEGHQLIQLYRRASPSDRAKLVRLAETLLGDEANDGNHASR